MKYLSLFSGIGGFELGIHRAFDVQEKRGGQEAAQGVYEGGGGLHSIPKQSPSTSTDTNNEHANRGVDQGQPHCIGYSEIDKYAIKVYERQFNGHTNYGDATNINAKELPDFDLLVGGFPCQAFSVAGKRQGFDDTRGTLFFDIARILAEKRPRHLVLENVKGLLSHDKGKTFQTILGVLSDLGYRVEWQVLNSKDFGVPQNRERIYIVGHLGNECGRKVFPISSTHRQDSEAVQRHLSNTLTARYEAAQATGTYIGEGQLDAQKIRRLTPKECERLQGFPDNWTRYGKATPEDVAKPSFRPGKTDPSKDIISDTQRYKMCGNAVTVNVVEAVITNLKGCL